MELFTEQIIVKLGVCDGHDVMQHHNGSHGLWWSHGLHPGDAVDVLVGNIHIDPPLPNVSLKF